MMDKKSKILITLFIIAILVSIFYTYKRSFVDRNFSVIEEEEIEEETTEETEEETE